MCEVLCLRVGTGKRFTRLQRLSFLLNERIRTFAVLAPDCTTPTQKERSPMKSIGFFYSHLGHAQRVPT